MKRNLSSVVEIKTGIFAKPILKGEAFYLQAKNFDESGKIVKPLFPDLAIDRLTQKHLLKVGDVLFAAKGSKNFAICFDEENMQAVASTTFFVLRIQSKLVLPEYLAWVLNNSLTQNFLKRNAIGTSMVSISKTVLEEMEISIPTLEKQKNILEISRLAKQENELRLKIAELRQIQIQQEIINAIK